MFLGTEITNCAGSVRRVLDFDLATIIAVSSDN